MMRRDVARAVGLVVVVAVLTAGGLWAATALTPAPTTEDAPGYEPPGEYDPNRTTAGGDISLEGVDGHGLVLIDDAHHNRVTDEQLRPLVNALSAAGYEVAEVSQGFDFERRLAAADAYVVIDPLRAFDPGEARSVREFAESGGRVLIFGEPSRQRYRDGDPGAGPNEARSRVGTLGSALGVEFETDYLLNQETNDGNFKHVFASGTGPLAALDRVVVRTATAVRASDGTTLLETTGRTRLSRADEPATNGVAVRTDNVLAVGDRSLLSAPTLADNEQFLTYAVRFLVETDRSGHLQAFPALLNGEPRVSYTNTDLLDAAQMVKRAGHTADSDPTVSFRAAPDDTDVLLTTYDYLAASDLEVPVDADGNFTGVDGHVVPADGTAIAVADRGGYDLLIAAADEKAAVRAVEVLNTSSMEDHLVASDVAILSGD